MFRPITKAAADLVDADAIKTILATVVGLVDYSGAGLNGAAVTANVATPRHGGAAASGFGAYPTITTAAATGAYVASSLWTFYGTWRGQSVTREARLTAVNGGETVHADGPLDTCTRITGAAQADTDGQVSFGWGGIAPQYRAIDDRVPFIDRVVGNGTGNIVARMAPGIEDTIPTIAAQAHDIHPEGLLGSTTAGVTLYLS